MKTKYFGSLHKQDHYWSIYGLYLQNSNYCRIEVLKIYEYGLCSAWSHAFISGLLIILLSPNLNWKSCIDAVKDCEEGATYFELSSYFK